MMRSDLIDDIGVLDFAEDGLLVQQVGFHLIREGA